MCGLPSNWHGSGRPGKFLKSGPRCLPLRMFHDSGTLAQRLCICLSKSREPIGGRHVNKVAIRIGKSLCIFVSIQILVGEGHHPRRLCNFTHTTLRMLDLS